MHLYVRYYPKGEELEAYGLIHSKEYPQVPPKVEYYITELGYSLIPIMSALCK